MSDAFLIPPVCNHPERFRLLCSAFSDYLRADEDWADPEAPGSPHVLITRNTVVLLPRHPDCLMVGGDWADPEPPAPALRVRPHPRVDWGRGDPEPPARQLDVRQHWDEAELDAPLHFPRVRCHPQHHRPPFSRVSDYLKMNGDGVESDAIHTSCVRCCPSFSAVLVGQKVVDQGVIGLEAVGEVMVRLGVTGQAAVDPAAVDPEGAEVFFEGLSCVSEPLSELHEPWSVDVVLVGRRNKDEPHPSWPD